MNPILIIIPVLFVIVRVLMNKSGLKSSEVAELVEKGAKFIDVRSQAEFKGGSVKKAINIPHDKISSGLKKNKISKETPLILFCASGMRSSAACSTLKSEGYTSVHNAGTKEKISKLLML
ncbi:MAG: rhodanese-like domain-containing protein [Spirochaetaceae bacterium]